MMFQDKCNHNCYRDYLQCNCNRLHLWFCAIRINCIWLCYNRSMSGAL